MHMFRRMEAADVRAGVQRDHDRARARRPLARACCCAPDSGRCGAPALIADRSGRAGGHRDAVGGPRAACQRMRRVCSRLLPCASAGSERRAALAAAWRACAVEPERSGRAGSRRGRCSRQCARRAWRPAHAATTRCWPRATAAGSRRARWRCCAACTARRWVRAASEGRLPGSSAGGHSWATGQRAPAAPSRALAGAPARSGGDRAMRRVCMRALAGARRRGHLIGRGAVGVGAAAWVGACACQGGRMAVGLMPIVT